MTEIWTKWEGQIVAGAFPLRRFLGGSDHSGVFLSEYPARNLPDAALKLVPAIPTLAESQLSQWAAALVALSHPHLLRLFEAGRCELGGLPFLFLVMEYAEQSLSQILPQRALTAEEVQEMLVPTLDALVYLHARHLVQGRLKPSSLLVVGDQLKLASDTIRPADESTADIAPPSVYDPPESNDGSFPASGDIWSLGVTLVEALTQHPPARPEAGFETASLPTTVPSTLVAIVRHCLSRSPADRPTAADLQAEIKPTPSSSVASELRPGTAATHADAPPPQTQAPPPQTQAPAPQARVPPPATRVSASRTEGLPPKSMAPLYQPIVRKVADPPIPPVSLPGQRWFMPAVAVILVVSIAVWAGVYLLGSRPSSQPVPVPAPASEPPGTPSSPARELSAPLSRPTADESAPTVAPPSVLHEEIPKVPRSARNTIHGRIKVTVRVTVDSSGNVVHETLDEIGPSPFFARLATQAAGKWKFAPADHQDSRKWLLRFEFTRGGTTAHAIQRM